MVHMYDTSPFINELFVLPNDSSIFLSLSNQICSPFLSSCGSNEDSKMLSMTLVHSS